MNLAKQQASATQLTQEYAPLKRLCETYGARPEDVALQADALFKKATAWQQEGFLDEDFEIASRQEPPSKSEGTKPEGSKPPSVETISSDQITEMAKKAVEDARSPLVQKIQRLEQGIEMLSNFHIESKLKEKYPDLEGEDITRILTNARVDPSKNLIQHAEDVVKYKGTKTSEMEKRFAEKYGIDIEKFDENKLKQQSAEGGGLKMFSGKKVVLDNRRAGEDSVTARDAMIAHLEAKSAAAQEG